MHFNDCFYQVLEGSINKALWLEQSRSKELSDRLAIKRSFEGFFKPSVKSRTAYSLS